jgi:hypothetical protein
VGALKSVRAGASIAVMIFCGEVGVTRVLGRHGVEHEEQTSSTGHYQKYGPFAILTVLLHR